ncbi:phytoene dehydrogenase-like protein [Rhodoligotrophos appendicifer]|uniref:phytoene desaturase family protein n=1 Tax=Rhodoligotrophos appendicifer TaxID=987056 RepID=UPI0011814B59|nr:NAD(P)/FAD-dependent oxidoreductase [Rhodoligotrophos appendicifer]
MPPSKSYDVIVIGAGHNGLVAAGLLAKKGRKVLVVEADSVVGGGARTVEIAPGFKVSGLAHVLTHLHSEVISGLDLERHGLSLSASDIDTIALDAGGRHLRIRRGDVEALSGQLDPADKAAWSALHVKLSRVAGVLKPFLAKTPPRFDFGSTKDIMTLGSLGLAIRRLGREDMREFLRMVLMNIEDVLDDEIEDVGLKGAIGFDAVLGTHMGPRSPNSLMTYYFRLAGDSGSMGGALALPKGGMGSVADALVKAAQAAGAEIRTDSVAARILVAEDRVTGVRLASGEEIQAKVVVCGANPRTTLMDLVGARHLDTGMVRRLKSIRMKGNVAKLNLALDGVPAFRGLETRHLAGRLVISPSLAELEEAFNPVKYGEASVLPAMELVIPSMTDASLAPAGKHVLSANVIYAPFEHKDGWETARGGFEASILDRLERYAPGIKDQIVASDLLTPADIEQRYRMPGGHWHHGELTIDQMFMLRPVPFAAQYDMPIGGLYLASAGCHPGGHIMGAAGMNAAKRVLEREGK